ncbi:hypothetical protein N665_0115s0003 [Sinapis alba]|nr:hypothetical protein N665_0115s0003 [Sinapis alba]
MTHVLLLLLAIHACTSVLPVNSMTVMDEDFPSWRRELRGGGGGGGGGGSGGGGSGGDSGGSGRVGGSGGAGNSSESGNGYSGGSSGGLTGTLLFIVFVSCLILIG